MILEKKNFICISVVNIQNIPNNNIELDHHLGSHHKQWGASIHTLSDQAKPVCLSVSIFYLLLFLFISPSLVLSFRFTSSKQQQHGLLSFKLVAFVTLAGRVSSTLTQLNACTLMPAVNSYDSLYLSLSLFLIISFSLYSL